MTPGCPPQAGSVDSEQLFGWQMIRLRLPAAASICLIITQVDAGELTDALPRDISIATGTENGYLAYEYISTQLQVHPTFSGHCSDGPANADSSTPFSCFRPQRATRLRCATNQRNEPAASCLWSTPDRSQLLCLQYMPTTTFVNARDNWLHLDLPAGDHMLVRDVLLRGLPVNQGLAGPSAGPRVLSSRSLPSNCWLGPRRCVYTHTLTKPS